MFASKTNLITECGVHPSLHPNFYHQIIYAKFNHGLTYKFLIHHNTTMSRITMMQIVNLLDVQLIGLIGKRPL